jgi:hypothetical protein
MKALASSLAALVVAAVALNASADPPRGKVITLKPFEIIGKRVVPIASIDVSKASVTLAPAELRQPLVDRIADSAHSSAL